MTTTIEQHISRSEFLLARVALCLRDKTARAYDPSKQRGLKSETLQKYADAIEMYKTGLTLEKIGQHYGVSRERIRQILSVHGIAAKDGGQTVVTQENKEKRERKLQEKRDNRYMKYWGVSHGIYGSFMETPEGRKIIRAYGHQRHSAQFRKVGWEISLVDWWNIWESSGHWKDRGIRLGQYVMARNGDVGPYKVGNVRIVKATENIREYYDRTRYTRRNENVPKDLFGELAAQRPDTSIDPGE